MNIRSNGSSSRRSSRGECEKGKQLRADAVPASNLVSKGSFYDNYCRKGILMKRLAGGVWEKGGLQDIKPVRCYIIGGRRI